MSLDGFPLSILTLCLSSTEALLTNLAETGSLQIFIYWYMSFLNSKRYTDDFLSLLMEMMRVMLGPTEDGLSSLP